MNIKDLRIKTGLSQKRFSGEYGIPVRTVQDWEAGLRTPPKYVVEMLAYLIESKKTNHSAWVFYEYRDKAAVGSYELFKTRSEAVSYAKDEWNHMNLQDKTSYVSDPVGNFWVAELPVEWDDISCAFEPDFSGYTPIWDAIEEEREKSKK